MKTKVLIFTIILCLGMVFQGCEKETPVKTDSVQKNKINHSVEKLIDQSYIVIDTINFELETEEDFENMFDLIIDNENQFIRTTYGATGEVYNIIMEPSGNTPMPNETNEMTYRCTFEGQSHSSSPSWIICLRGFIDVYNYNVEHGICMDHNGLSARNGVIWIVEVEC